RPFELTRISFVRSPSAVPIAWIQRAVVALGVCGFLADAASGQLEKKPLEVYRVDGPQAASFFSRVEWLGDLNGDGYDDFAVGADRWDRGPRSYPTSELCFSIRERTALRCREPRTEAAPNRLFSTVNRPTTLLVKWCRGSRT